MKTKITRLKLAVDNDEGDYVLLGIACAEPDYKLSLLLNKELGILLRNVPAIKPDDQEHVFSKFSNSNRTEKLVFNLISNRSGKIYLISKLKNIDFLLQVQDFQDGDDIEEIISKLRNIEGVTGVFNIEVGSLKDKNLSYL